tara:strand:- start:739 stop:2538 length:1800 start_codon:yes stop_codon:yes gene_type:complete
MAFKKKVPIKYTSRDFDSIKQDLIDYARRYYADSFRDFSEASFGSLMIDTVSYIGDILSFYLDYQVNESFLSTATDYNNVLRLGQQSGYKFRGAATAFGQCAFIIKVPANTVSIGPDTKYLPIIQKGTTLSSLDGATFILNEDINFNDPGVEVESAEQNATTGQTTFWALQAFGQVISGELGSETISVGDFERFKKVKLSANDITEILSITDSEGNEYFEVDNLSQNVVYRSIPNRNYVNEGDATAVLKPHIVPRRFVVQRTRQKTTLQFGYGSKSQLNQSAVAEPSDIVLKKTGRTYISETSFDPSKLLETDKFGIAPSNTTLTITYRKNSVGNTNAASRAITSVLSADFSFKDPAALNNQSRIDVIRSLEVINYDPIVGDVALPSVEELKQIINGTMGAQNRAVTAQDYQALVYSMPPQFGAIKRCSIYRDSDSFKRNMNLYVLSQDSGGDLVTTSTSVKTNLKTWLSRNKIINDTIDILDAKVVNIQIKFTAVSVLGVDKFDVLANANSKLKEMYSQKMDIGSPFNIADIYTTLNKVRGVADVRDVDIVNVNSTGYSNISFSIEDHISADGRFVNVPKNVVLEIKYLDTDIIGSVE